MSLFQTKEPPLRLFVGVRESYLIKQAMEMDEIHRKIGQVCGISEPDVKQIVLKSKKELQGEQTCVFMHRNVFCSRSHQCQVYSNDSR